MRLNYTIKRTNDFVRAAQIYRTLHVHDRWTPEEMAKFQKERLLASIRRAAAQSPFHRKRCGALAASDAIRLEDIPIMDKETMMEPFDEVVTDPRLKLENLQRHLQELTQDDYYLGEYRVLSTSGSSRYE